MAMPISAPMRPQSAASASTIPRIIDCPTPTALRIPIETRRRITAAAAEFPTKNIPTINETRLKAVRFILKAESMMSTCLVRLAGGSIVTLGGRIFPSFPATTSRSSGFFILSRSAVSLPGDPTHSWAAAISMTATLPPVAVVLVLFPISDPIFTLRGPPGP